MESLWKLVHLLEPAPLALMLTAISVTFASAVRALTHGKEMERNRDVSEASITLGRSQALMIPIFSSFSLLLMFYLFSSLAQVLTAFTSVASVYSLFFCFAPIFNYIGIKFGLSDPFCSRCCSNSFSRNQGFLLILCAGTVLAWLVSGNWVLNNLLGISICISFVSHVRFPNVKICALLLFFLFCYDIFWVYFSEKFFGANVMVSVATQKASNPIHTVVSGLSLPGIQMITKKLELPVKIVFPRNLMGGDVPGSSGADYMMLGLGDMAIPGMLLAFVLCYDYQRSKDSMNCLDLSFWKGQRYIWYAVAGYAIGLVVALATGTLTHSPQPALLFLVPSTLGPIIFVAWMRKELVQLWDGTGHNPNEKGLEVQV